MMFFFPARKDRLFNRGVVQTLPLLLCSLFILGFLIVFSPQNDRLLSNSDVEPNVLGVQDEIDTRVGEGTSDKIVAVIMEFVDEALEKLKTTIINSL